MRKALTVILLLPFIVFAQDLKKIRKKSVETLIYRIPADSSYEYIRNDSIPIDAFVNRQPTYRMLTDSINESVLPKGHYLFISVLDNEIKARLFVHSDLILYAINNDKNFQLVPRDKDGNIIREQVKAWINNKEIKFNSGTESFCFKRIKENALIKITSLSDTAFIRLNKDEDPDISVSKQKWLLFKETGFFKLISYIPEKVGTLFKKQNNKFRFTSHSQYKGFIVFNQPKFKLGDTVKMKAYILTPRQKRLNKAVNIYMVYYARGKSEKQFLKRLTPSTAGSFIYEFVLSDTLFNDTRYNIQIEDDHKKTLVTNYFKTEDYVLDEVASYTLRAQKDKYYKGDSLVFFANAKDANGLNLLDVKTKLIITVKSIENYWGNTVFIPDTLYTEEAKLSTKEDTRFVINSSLFPTANLILNATVHFLNSNNELQEANTTVEYKQGENELVLTQKNDSIYAEFYVNGKSVKAAGSVEIDADKVEWEKHITYPYQLKIDPLADAYDFYVDSPYVYEYLDVERRYNMNFSGLSQQDTLGFTLYNPYKIPVHYIILDGDRLVGQGTGNEETIKWLKKEKNRKVAYKVKWQYLWKGEVCKGENTIGHSIRNLNIQIKALPSVFPGQKDTIAVAVNDYKGNPVSDVNLTAFSYNSQFKKDIRLPSLPSFYKWKVKQNINRTSYDIEDASLEKQYYLGSHQQWRKILGTDSLLYYQMLFPSDTIMFVSNPIKDYIPQFSIHVVKKGIPQDIFLMYLNRELIYYKSITDKQKFAFNANGGYAKIGLRLIDKFVEIDSIYLQPYYKHDIIIDVDRLPANSKILTAKDELSDSEKKLLEETIWQLKSDYKTNYAYVWQNRFVYKLSGNYNHLIGPFKKLVDINVFAPGQFDIYFPFEPGYEYHLSPRIARLEKKPLFKKDEAIKLITSKKAEWILGDTVLNQPVIAYPVSNEKRISLSYHWSNFQKSYNNDKGSLFFNLPKDSVILYVILKNSTDSIKDIVFGKIDKIYNLLPGKWTLRIVNNSFKSHSVELVIKPNYTTCIHISKFNFINDPYVDDLTNVKIQIQPVKQTDSSKHEKSYQENFLVVDKNGNATITGNVIDAVGGKPITGTSVMVKGSRIGTITDENGYFSIAHLKNGKYTLVISLVGYATYEKEVEVDANKIVDVKIQLNIATSQLDEVVVMGYGSVTKKAFTGSQSVVSVQSLSGIVPGVNISGIPGAADNISVRIRGFASLELANKPLYVIDGILYDALPPGLTEKDIESVEILKDGSAVSLYGVRAENGVVIIKTTHKTQRNIFRDYAFWQPELFTDNNGKIKFAVQYPDNITSWQTYVVGIDKKNRTGINMHFTKAFKPVMAQLSVPQFAIDGDNLNVIHKTLNYTKDNYNVKAQLHKSDVLLADTAFELEAASSVTRQFNLLVNNTDSVKLKFNIQTSTGFRDGEERKIPVYDKGTEEATGNFWVLKNDTSVQFNTDKSAPVFLNIHNNTLNVFLDELEKLRIYPFYCMEQTASKLRGYAMERKIRKLLGQKFEHENEFNQLLQKVQKAQLYSGAWSWWENGKANLSVSVYILQTLLEFRELPIVNENIRNGLLFVQNQVSGLKGDDLLSSLTILVEAGHVFDYNMYLSKLDFDSISMYQQWQYVRMKQLLKLDYKKELKYLIGKQQSTSTGGVYWGKETWLWYNNHIATTLLAYKVLSADHNYSYLSDSIIQYLLEEKSNNGYWRNTVETASILNAILPATLNSKGVMTPATIKISGDTSFDVKTFPYKVRLSSKVQHLQIEKQGEGYTYVTAFQQFMNKEPKAIADNFLVQSYFEKDGKALNTLKAGERVQLHINVKALKESNYVIVEIPIPAGCIIVDKKSYGYEYSKNKVFIFLERMHQGNHDFYVQLECRYTGNYTLNPAKASLMYFPVMFGRNSLNRVEITD